MQRNVELQKISRLKKKENIEKVCAMNPEAKEILKSANRGTVGKPPIGKNTLKNVFLFELCYIFPIETDQPHLLSTIVDLIETDSSAAHGRRRTEELRSLVTLDDLMRELNLMGFKISRSATYLRLMPKRGNTKEAKRHVRTVPVKLLR